MLSEAASKRLVDGYYKQPWRTISSGYSVFKGMSFASLPVGCHQLLGGLGFLRQQYKGNMPRAAI